MVNYQWCMRFMQTMIERIGCPSLHTIPLQRCPTFLAAQFRGNSLSRREMTRSTRPVTAASSRIIRTKDRHVLIGRHVCMWLAYWATAPTRSWDLVKWMDDLYFLFLGRTNVLAKGDCSFNCSRLCYLPDTLFFFCWTGTGGGEIDPLLSARHAWRAYVLWH
jgi:hypothetical protein